MELTIKLLLGLVALSVARPRTVYRFKGDDAEHWLEGAPGESVRGFYSWISPEGSEFYVKYIADQNGYRILDSNAVPVDHSGVAADGNQVMTEPLEMDMVPLSHDGLVIFDSSKIEPKDQAIVDSADSVPSNNGNSEIVISQEEVDLSETSERQSNEPIEIDPIPIVIDEDPIPIVIDEDPIPIVIDEDPIPVVINEDPIPVVINIDIIPIVSEESIEEEQEESTQLPVIQIVDIMLEASSSFGEKTDVVAMVPSAAPSMDNTIAMSDIVEDIVMVDESKVEAELVESMVIPMEIETIQRGGKKRIFTPIKMKNGDLTFMELKPVSVSLEGVSISSTTEACEMCEMQYDYDYIDDTLRNV